MSVIARVPHPGNTEDDPATGGMIALVPDDATVANLRVKGGLPSGELHLTLAYLGDNVGDWTPAAKFDVIDRVRTVIDLLDGALPLDARAFAHMTFNPDGGPDGDRDPCAVYGIGDSVSIPRVREHVLVGVSDTLQARRMALPDQHTPFIPHITAGYGLQAADLTYVGAVRFDRVAVVLGADWIEVRP